MSTLTPEDEADITGAVMRTVDFVVDGRGDAAQHASALRRCVEGILARHADRGQIKPLLDAHVEELKSPGACSCGYELWDGTVDECRSAYRDHLATVIASSGAA